MVNTISPNFKYPSSFYAPLIKRHKTIVHLSSYLWLGHVLELHLNGLLPFSSWFGVRMVPDLMYVCSIFSLGIVSSATMLIVDRSIKNQIFFHCLFLCNLLDSLVGVLLYKAWTFFITLATFGLLWFHLQFLPWKVFFCFINTLGITKNIIIIIIVFVIAKKTYRPLPS